MAKKRPADPQHKYYCTCVSKITSYKRVGNLTMAAVWARNLQAALQKEGLLDASK